LAYRQDPRRKGTTRDFMWKRRKHLTQSKKSISL
jgi:hypothetical protein